MTLDLLFFLLVFQRPLFAMIVFETIFCFYPSATDISVFDVIKYYMWSPHCGRGGAALEMGEYRITDCVSKQK